MAETTTERDLDDAYQAILADVLSHEDHPRSADAIQILGDAYECLVASRKRNRRRASKRPSTRAEETHVWTRVEEAALRQEDSLDARRGAHAGDDVPACAAAAEAALRAAADAAGFYCDGGGPSPRLRRSGDAEALAAALGDWAVADCSGPLADADVFLVDARNCSVVDAADRALRVGSTLVLPHAHPCEPPRGG